MKNTIKRCSLGFTLLTASIAVGQDGRFYVKGDVGGNVTQDTDLKEFFGPVNPETKVKFDPGFRFGVAGGYQVTDWFGAEGELGFMENNINSITGASRVHDAWFANAPFLVNGKFQWPNRSLLTPYIGAGVGFSETILSVDQITLNGTSLHGDNWDTVFAYQAFAGVRCKITDRMGVGIEYRYFHADAPEWNADFASNTFSDTMRFGNTQTHALSLTFEFRF